VSIHEPPLMSLVAEDESLAPLVQQTGAALAQVIAQLHEGDIEGGTRRFMEEVALGPGAWDLLPQSLQETAIANAPAFLGEMMDPEGLAIDAEALRQLPFPLQLTQGTESPKWFGAIVAQLEQMADDASVHTFAGAGHAPHLTSPADFVAGVAGFIAQAERSSVVIGAGV
jgi:pimeloyl-ACP methyl ester carboxylesterase